MNNLDIYIILFKLVKLKEYKDNFGKDDYYNKLQPLLWKHAKKVLEENYPYKTFNTVGHNDYNEIKVLDADLTPDIEKYINESQEMLNEFQAISGIPAELFKKVEIKTINLNYFKAKLRNIKLWKK